MFKIDVDKCLQLTWIICSFNRVRDILLWFILKLQNMLSKCYDNKVVHNIKTTIEKNLVNNHIVLNTK